LAVLFNRIAVSLQAKDIAWLEPMLDMDVKTRDDSGLKIEIRELLIQQTTNN